MRIAFDCRYVRTDRHDGISRYSTRLVAALAARHPVTMLVSDPAQLAVLPDLPWLRLGSPTGPGELITALRLRRLGWAGADTVVFSPMQTMGSLGRRHGLVLTLHDLIYYRHRRPPPNLPVLVRLLWRLYHCAWWPQRILLDRADAVATVSHTTAWLIAAHRLTRRPVTVVPNAADPPVEEPHPARTTDLVYAGSFMPYKDVDTLVRAMTLLPEHTLHLISRVSHGQRSRLTALAPGSRLVFHDGASDETYRRLLGAATALVTASREEGFGLPLAEAMSLGTPVVVTDIPVFREVAGDAGAYVAPGDAAGFARAVRELSDPVVFDARGAAARERAARHGWDASAEILLRLLTEVAARRLTVADTRRRAARRWTSRR